MVIMAIPIHISKKRSAAVSIRCIANNDEKQIGMLGENQILDFAKFEEINHGMPGHYCNLE